VGALRTTALAAVVAAFLVTPPALLAEQTASGPEAFSSAGPAGYDAAAQPSAMLGQSAASATLRTTGSGSDETTGEVPSAYSSAAASVTIGDFFFRPQDVTVTEGASITWTNDGTVPEGHTVTGDGFDSGVLKHGDTYSHTFDNAGTFDYVCTLHPNMRGTITVTASSSTGGTTSSGDTSSESGEDAQSSPPAESATPVASDASGSGGSLAQTGLNLILLAEIGGCLIATGLLIRRLIYG
jgi:plastocyanin